MNSVHGVPAPLAASLSKRFKPYLQIALGAHVPLWIAVAAEGLLRKRFSPGCKGYRNRSSARDFWSRRAALECCGHSNIGVLAASANVSHDAIDPRVFFFKELLERGSRCEHIDRTRLVVARRGRPGSGCSLVSRGPGPTRRN